LIKILIDNSVRQHAVALKGEWQSNGVQYWGGEIPIETGKISSKLKSRQMKIGPQEGAIAALANEFLHNNIEAYTTDALSFETFHQPLGRFTGVNYGDFSLFSKIKYKKINTLDDFSFCVPPDDIVGKLREHLNQSNNPLFLKIKNALPDKSSQDAWHLYCVGRFDLDIFLTTDSALIGQIKSISDENFKNELIKIVRTPEELCTDLDIRCFSEDEIICFAREDLHIDSFWLS